MHRTKWVPALLGSVMLVISLVACGPSEEEVGFGGAR